MINQSLWLFSLSERNIFLCLRIYIYNKTFSKMIRWKHSRDFKYWCRSQYNSHSARESLREHWNLLKWFDINNFDNKDCVRSVKEVFKCQNPIIQCSFVRMGSQLKASEINMLMEKLLKFGKFSLVTKNREQKITKTSWSICCVNVDAKESSTLHVALGKLIKIIQP